MPRPIDPMVLDAMEQKDPDLVARYRQKMQMSDSEMDDAKQSQDIANYSGMAGNLATDFVNSQRGGVILGNRLDKLGNAPTVVKQDPYEWDNSITERISDQKMKAAKEKRDAIGKDLATDDQFSQVSMARDPNSEASKRARDGIKLMAPNMVGSIADFDRLTAEQAEKLMPNLKAKWQGDRDDAKQKQEMDFKRQLLEAKTKPGGGIKLTDGQKSVDKDFAKDYNEWTSGGSKSAREEISKLEALAGKLRSADVTTGGLTGMFPDRMTSNSLLGARADIRSSITKSLRQIYGASFTEGEGNRVIADTWNEADSTENNLKRLERLVVDLKNQAGAKDKKASHFEQNDGSLANYKADPDTGGASGSWETGKKTIVKQQRSPSTGKIKIIYSDGTEEVKDAD